MNLYMVIKSGVRQIRYVWLSPNNRVFPGPRRVPLLTTKRPLIPLSPLDAVFLLSFMPLYAWRSVSSSGDRLLPLYPTIDNKLQVTSTDIQG